MNKSTIETKDEQTTMRVESEDRFSEVVITPELITSKVHTRK